MMRATFVVALCVAAAGQLRAQASDSTPSRAVQSAQQPAQQPAPSVGPPIRRISTASAVSREPIGSILAVRELPDGRVLVNDGGSRRLLLMDTMLVTERVVLDSMTERENTYGNRAGALIAQRGDSSLFIDASSLSLLVIDPAGNIARVRSVPRAQDVNRYGSNSNSEGGDASDMKGRLIYRVEAEPARPTRAPPRGVPWFPVEPDSSFIVALDIESRKLDTIGVVRRPKSELIVRLNPGGGFNVNGSINPLPSQDDWVVLADGSVAFLRGLDYRVDYLNADGTRSSSQKIPFDWQPLSDEMKERIVDSVRTSQSRNIRTSFTTSVIRYVNTYDRKYPPNFTAPDGYVPPNGFAKNWRYPPGVKFPERYIYACEAGVEPTMTQASSEVTPAGASASPADPAAAEREVMMRAMMGGAGPGQPGGGRGTPSCIPMPIPNLAQIPNPPTMREVSVISPKALPDFRPPFGANALRADMDGNLWIRTIPSKPIPGGPVYDIVTRAGELVDRLQVPPGYSLVGFGRGRVVYLSMRDASGIHLARVRLK
jgi:hypothetical protein